MKDKFSYDACGAPVEEEGFVWTGKIGEKLVGEGYHCYRCNHIYLGGAYDFLKHLKGCYKTELPIEYPFPPDDWRCWDFKIDTFADFDESNCKYGE